MKNILVLIIALIVMGIAQESYAQQHRTTTTTRRVPSRQTTTVTTQRGNKPQEKFVKEFAIYNVRARSIDKDRNYIYYIEDNSNNAVKRIDRKTGEISIVIEGQDGVYEGRRPELRDIWIVSNRLVFQTGNNFSPGYWMIQQDDGMWKKRTTDRDDWEGICGRNGKYLLAYSYNEDIYLYDMESQKQLIKFTSLSRSVLCGVDSNGNVWKYWPKSDEHRLGFTRYNKTDGKGTFYNLQNQPYIANEGVETVNFVRFANDFFYVAAGRRIYRMSTANPGQWEEYCKIPPTEDNYFKRFWVNSKGDILMKGDFTEFYRAGSFDRPQNLGKNLITGFNSYSFSEYWLDQADLVTVDADDNFVILSNKQIVIYNPNGVVGYEKARGKHIEP